MQTDTDWSQTIAKMSSAIIAPLTAPPRTRDFTTSQFLYNNAVQNAVTVDAMAEVKYCRLPGDKNGGEKSWTSYLFLLGMTVIDQALKPL